MWLVFSPIRESRSSAPSYDSSSSISSEYFPILSVVVDSPLNGWQSYSVSPHSIVKSAYMTGDSSEYVAVPDIR